MLTLSRHAGQRIVLNPGTDDEIVLTYLGMRGGQGRIGITAPLHVFIAREEILDEAEDGDDSRRKGA